MNVNRIRIVDRIMAALLCLGMLGAVIGLIVVSSLNMGRRTYYDTFDAYSDEIYELNGLKMNSAGRYQIQMFLEKPGSEQEWMLAFIEAHPFVLYVNRQEVYRYEASDGYRRVINVELGNRIDTSPAVSIEIETDQWDTRNYLYLGPKDRMEAAFLANMSLQLIEIGFLIAVMIYAFSLFRRKSSEKYLWPFAIYVTILLVWSAIQIEAYPLVFNIAFFDYLRSFFNLLTILESIHVGMILSHHEMPRYSGLMAWYNCLVVSLIYARLDQMIAPTPIGPYFSLLPFFVGMTAALYMCINTGVSGAFLPLTFTFSQAMRLLSVMIDRMELGNHVVFQCLRTVPTFDILFLVACVLEINLRFAGKFQESDELVVKLNHANDRLEEINAQLEEVNTQLDIKVEERTAQLKKEEQQRRQLMLNVFHDLRSPIFILKGYTEMMPAESEEAKENLAVMKDKLQFLYNLTEDLFLLSKLEDNKILFCDDAVDLGDLLYGIVESEKIEAAAKQIQITSQLEDERFLIGDSFRLEQAFQNIISNAIKYTPAGGRIEIRMHREGDELITEVEDNGIGIPEEDREKIFQLYYYRDRTSKSTSTGLGLAITQEIVKHHNGRIEVESTVGEGSTFIIHLPAMEE